MAILKMVGLLVLLVFSLLNTIDGRNEFALAGFLGAVTALIATFGGKQVPAK